MFLLALLVSKNLSYSSKIFVHHSESDLGNLEVSVKKFNGFQSLVTFMNDLRLLITFTKDPILDVARVLYPLLFNRFW